MSTAAPPASNAEGCGLLGAFELGFERIDENADVACNLDLSDAGLPTLE
ncbi:MAG: hypothetical protein JRF55_05255 [Deltaproteobacteria bacterium]|nr:hypothetical protein [Deltaproteobacteria bacterium]